MYECMYVFIKPFFASLVRNDAAGLAIACSECERNSLFSHERTINNLERDGINNEKRKKEEGKMKTQIFLW